MSVASKYRFISALCLLIVIANTWLAAHSLRVMFDAEHWLTHTLHVLSETQSTTNDLYTAYNDSRVYWLTGYEPARQRYFAEERALQTDMDRLKKTTADNASQTERLRILSQRVSVRFAAIDIVMGLNPAISGLPVPENVKQAALSDTPDGGISPRYAIGQIEMEERRLLDDRQATAMSARHHVVASFAAAAVLDVVFLILAFELLVRAQQSRLELAHRSDEIAHLNAELTASNASLEARVADRTRELEIANKELEAFSYSVSHDLRAPLRTIDGFSLALKEDFSECLNEEGQDYIARVRNGVQRMGTLIDALLQLSRVTRSELQRERLDMTAMVSSVFEELKAGAPERTVELVAQPGVVATADPRLVRIALENLVGNAFKYSAKTERAVVEFGSDVRDNRTVYFIKDNGVGFDMQYVDRLFTAFQRLHGDRDFKGSGIGLATVSRIIRRHHGDIWAEGEVDKGSTFYFTLDAKA